MLDTSVGNKAVTFSAKERHRPLTSTELYCLVTEEHVREQLAQSRYLAVHQARVKPAISWSPVRHAIVTPSSLY